ncbi:hypothetical protein PIROE2DRAFT_6009 [Piromyces sp. E2]|nr:hypothetical protein PIROE2DRAFT_6009 [Piromyces sp. E2]|eukprot:OUM66696.1 hypothetical protein PIROE2DRAFT_6009 [Piromyces sp. E2]
MKFKNINLLIIVLTYVITTTSLPIKNKQIYGVVTNNSVVIEKTDKKINLSLKKRSPLKKIAGYAGTFEIRPTDDVGEKIESADIELAGQRIQRSFRKIRGKRYENEKRSPPLKRAKKGEKK